MSPSKLLLTGVSGYIGGSVLTTLLTSKKGTIKDLSISALVRGDAQITKMKELGVNPIEFHDLDDTEVIQKAAREHDVIVHMAMGYHPGSAKALILGLEERKKSTGKEVHYIQTSGASNLGDNPITKAYSESHEFSDIEDIYSYEKKREALSPYFQRTTELLAIETAIESDVKIYVLMPPTIYGIGLGHFNVFSSQIPMQISVALKQRRPVVVGNGAGVWDYVHIADLADLYELILDKIVEGEDIPHGKKGIYFTGAGRESFLSIAKAIGKAGLGLGVLDDAEPREITLEEAEELFGWPSTVLELALASNARTKADLAKAWGWEPQKTIKDFEETFATEIKAILSK